MTFSLPEPSQLQRDHAEYMATMKKAADFSEPGAGKTITALLAAQDVGGKVLVICPPIAVRMWVQALAAFFDTANVLAVRASSECTAAKLAKADHVVTTYTLATTRKQTFAAQCKHSVLILDEAHALKSLTSKRTEAVYGARALMGPTSIAGNATAVFALTGTPVLRHADDLFPHIKALRPDLLATVGATSYDAFIKLFCYSQMRSYHPRQRPKPVIMGSRNEQILNAMVYKSLKGTQPLAVRRMVSDIKTLPPLIEQVKQVDYDLTPELMEATLKVNDFEAEDGSMSTVRRLLGAAKVAHVAPELLVLQRAVKRPVLCFYWHREVGAAYKSALEAEGFRVAMIDGATSTQDRLNAEDAFNARAVDFLLGQIQSMGVALNLQHGSNYAAFLERDWSPANETQAIARLFRLGQEHKVVCQHFLTEHPADLATVNVGERKKATHSRINAR